MQAGVLGDGVEVEDAGVVLAGAGVCCQWRLSWLAAVLMALMLWLAKELWCWAEGCWVEGSGAGVAGGGVLLEGCGARVAGGGGAAGRVWGEGGRQQCRFGACRPQ